ncbi:hypothetical protein [Cohnella cholangitidis]|uniref:Uncharacterized protein n=1 Tax=Cohnella cholangitidis TaxID=2598458 RepID=A0A7G5C0X9_9BACL|nr:hypothetical protein [Cohnella cholangitidis]QMV42863.1 hypothetical protein FPL14_17965 [Cohnella cholangitidis]
MKPPMLNREELRMVKESILIPIMLDYLESDIHTAQSAGFKLDMILIHGLKKVQDDIINEHYSIKKQLRERGIKVLPEERTKLGVEADYLCRGYQHHMTLLWGTVRTETLKKASEYTGVKLTDG